MAEKKIVIVEDNEQNMELFRDLLLSKGYDIIEAKDGEEAVNMVLKEMPDMILMDIQIPKIDGVGAVKKIRANPATRNIIILAITAHAMKGDREIFLNAGFNDYIAKPINIKSFLQTIEGYLNKTG